MTGPTIKSVFLGLLLLWGAAFAKADENRELDGWFAYLYEIDNSLLDSIWGVNGLRHLGGIAATYYLVNDEVDWRYNLYFRDRRQLQWLTFPSVIIGSLGPVVLPLYLQYYGKKEGNRHKRYAAYATGQALIVSLAITSTYKALTGRLEPGFRNDEDRSLQESKKFQFGFFNNGIFNGWPSGHATTAMAIATSLVYIYPERKTEHLWLYGTAAYVAFGITTNIHWLSDGVAGALMGYGIGKTVGIKYHNLLLGRARQRRQLQLIPLVGREYLGGWLSYRF